MLHPANLTTEILRGGRPSHGDDRHYLDSVWAKVLSHLNDAVFVLDRSGMVVLCTSAGAELLGMSREDVLGLHVTRLADGLLDRRHSVSMLRRVLNDGTWSGEGEITRRDGKTRSLAVHASSIDKDGHAVGVLAIVRDVTSQRERERKLNRHLQIKDALLDVSRELSLAENVDFGTVLEKIGTAIEAQSLYLVTTAGNQPSPFSGQWRWPDDGRHIEQEIMAALGTDGEVNTVTAPAHMEPLYSSSGTPLGQLWVVYGYSRPSGRSDDLRVVRAVAEMLSRHLERNQSNYELQKSEERWKCVVEHQPDPVFVLRDGNVAYLNKAASDLLGVPHGTLLIGDSLSRLVSAATRKTYDRHLEHAVRKGNAGPSSFDLSRPDGDLRTVESFSVAITYEGTDAQLMVLHDVTQVQRSEERYRTFFHAISEGFFRVDLTRPIPTGLTPDEQVEAIMEHGLVGECNALMARMMGSDDCSELVGLKLRDLDKEVRKYVRLFVSSGLNVRNREVTVECDDGLRYYRLNATGITERGRLKRIWGSCTEVTDRVNLEREMVSALEDQQQALGHELHDSLGQMLTGIRILTEHLSEKIGNESSELSGHVKHLLDFANEASTLVRNIHQGLTPSDLFRGENLRQSIEELTARIGRITGVKCSFASDDVENVIDREGKVHLYRIVQEAVNNAVKHADADRIRISLRRLDGDRIELSIRDDGVGFDLDRLASDTLGIRSMEYRSRIIGADLTIDSNPGDGTRVRCRLSARRHPVNKSGDAKPLEDC